MSQELDDWRREQINSRPTARRKIREHEARLSEARWKRQERWETPKLVAQGVGVGLLIVALGMVIVIGVPWLWPPIPRTPAVLDSTATVDYSSAAVRDGHGTVIVWESKR